MKYRSFLAVVIVAMLGASAAHAQQKAFDIYNANVMLDESMSFANPAPAPEPVSIVAARNGSFSGMVVAVSAKAMSGVSATVSDFRQSGGSATIPAAAAFVRYGLPGNWWQLNEPQTYPTKGFRGFGGLSSQPPKTVPVIETVDPRARKPLGKAVQPIWLTVAVPATAKPGQYEATLTISAGGQKSAVPVKLTVHDFALNSPRQWTTLVDLVQSPETVALTYNVPIWSDEHFKLLEPSIKLLAEGGDRTAYVHLVAQTNHANAHTMVLWTAKPDGTYSYDFTPMNRYLELVKKHYGKVDVVCLYLWDAWMEGGDHRSLDYWRKTNQTERIEAWEKNHGGGPIVSVKPIVSAKGQAGELTTISLPARTTPEGKKIWNDFGKALLAELKKQGFTADNLALGMLGDQVPPQDVLDVLQQAMPGIDWVKQSHSMKVYNANAKETEGWQVKFAAFVWGAEHLHPSQLRHGWQGDEFRMCYPRGIATHSPVLTFRHLGEMNIGGNQRGFGRIGGDFWPALKNSRGEVAGDIIGRFPHAEWKNLDIGVTLLAAGPDGAVATRRYEMMREGLQECEARIFIDRALTTPALRAKLGPQLAAQCEKALLARNAAILKGFNITQPNEWRDFYGWKNETKTKQFDQQFYASQWQPLSNELYSLAATVAAKIGGPTSQANR